LAKVTMPQLGESVAEGTIGKWLKKPGDHVDKYEPLLEVITDKVNAEVPSPFAGTLTEILVEEGATVPNNAEIAVIEEAGAAAASAPAAEPAKAAPAQASGATAASSSPAPTVAAAAAPAEVKEPEPTPAPSASPAGSPAAASSAPSSSASMTAASTSVAQGPAGSDERAVEELPGSSDARMTPAVRRLLREHGLNGASIVGTGGGGRITREDVTDYVESQRTGAPVGKQNAAARPSDGASAAAPSATPVGATPQASPAVAPSAAPAPAPAPAPSPAPAAAATPGGPAASRGGFGGQRVQFPDGADEVLVPTSQMRKGIAAQMTKALQVPHAYVAMEVDLTGLVRLREREKRAYQEREGLSLSFVPFVVKAAAEALKRHPALNAHWTEQGLLAKRRINVGIAVAVEDGLIVPVVRDVDQLSINGLNRAIADVSARARAGHLRVDDFGGGTFTVDNTGWLGSNLTMPIINVPEVAILTMEDIRKRPVVVETPDGDVIGIRPIMNMVLAIDHRANDGAGATALLRDIKTWLEAVGSETPIY
jgi:pyruvate/2-oxoglutarate dehydrogenase complex dihydrolipoamide acyltransferase (E2) component